MQKQYIYYFELELLNKQPMQDGHFDPTFWVTESRKQISYAKHNNTLVTRDREFGVKKPVKTYLVTSLLIDYSKPKFLLRCFTN